jgi:SH3 domain
MAESDSNPREQLPAMTFSDGGPPYSEDEDLQSPIVTTSKHKKQKSSSSYERGRSPGAAGSYRGAAVSVNSGGDDGGHAYDSLYGPGNAIVEESQYQSYHPHQPLHRDSNFAKPLQRDLPTTELPEHPSDDERSGPDDDSDDARFSKDYSFTIASPDEEMHGKAVALFDFKSEHQNELPLKEGQIILVSYRHGQGWLVAEDPRSGESGLVPEEYVRLVKDIEGGLNGLEAVDFDGVDDNDARSPTSVEPSQDVTPKPNNHEFSQNRSTSANGITHNERHPPVQSTFSTSSKDLDPYPLPRRSEDITANS